MLRNGVEPKQVSARETLFRGGNANYGIQSFAHRDQERAETCHCVCKPATRKEMMLYNGRDESQLIRKWLGEGNSWGKGKGKSCGDRDLLRVWEMLSVFCCA